MGTYPDYRLQPDGSYVYRLDQLFKGYKKEDDPTKRVKPVPLAIVRRAKEAARGIKENAIGDMCIIGFFFLNRPGEHVQTSNPESNSTPFRLCDVTFIVQGRRWRGHEIPLEALGAARSTTLLYTNQKNGVQGQGINQGSTTHEVLCPTKTVARRVRHLRENGAPKETPLYTYFDETGSHGQVYSQHLTTALRKAAEDTFSELGIAPEDISARSLRPGGATAMLCARIDTNIIRIVGRWKSDEMLIYLHAEAESLMRNYAQQVFQSGAFTYCPRTDVEDPNSFLAQPTQGAAAPSHPDGETP